MPLASNQNSCGEWRLRSGALGFKCHFLASLFVDGACSYTLVPVGNTLHLSRVKHLIFLMQGMAGTSRLPKMDMPAYTTLDKCPAGFSGRQVFSIGYVATASRIYTRHLIMPRWNHMD